MQVLLAELDRVARDNVKQEHIAPIILTGDFNIQQNSEVFRLIIGESVRPRDLFERMDFKYENLNRNLLPCDMGITDKCQFVSRNGIAINDRYQAAVRIYHFI